MGKATFIKRDGALWPVDDTGREIMAALRNDKEVSVIIHSPRNIKHLKLFQCLLHRIVDSGAWPGTKETLDHYIKLEAHHVHTIVGHDGKVHYVPRSIAVESMSQAEFKSFYDRALYVISTRILGRKDDDWKWLRDEIAAAVDGSLPERRGAA